MDGLDLDQLTPEEQEKILYVLQRDDHLRKKQDGKTNQLKTEVRDIRMKGVLREGENLNKLCVRCHAQLGFLFNKGDNCAQCNFKVCKNCRVALLSGGWACMLCFKQMQLKWVSGEWIHCSPGWKKRTRRLSGSDIVKCSLYKLAPSSGNAGKAMTEEICRAITNGNGPLSERHERSGSFDSSSIASSTLRDSEVERVGFPTNSDTYKLSHLIGSLGSKDNEAEERVCVKRASSRRYSDSDSDSSSSNEGARAQSKAAVRASSAGSSERTQTRLEHGCGADKDVSLNSLTSQQTSAERTSFLDLVPKEKSYSARRHPSLSSKSGSQSSGKIRLLDLAASYSSSHNSSSLPDDAIYTSTESIHSQRSGLSSVGPSDSSVNHRGPSIADDPMSKVDMHKPKFSGRSSNALGDRTGGNGKSSGEERGTRADGMINYNAMVLGEPSNVSEEKKAVIPADNEAASWRSAVQVPTSILITPSADSTRKQSGLLKLADDKNSSASSWKSATEEPTQFLLMPGKRSTSEQPNQQQEESSSKEKSNGFCQVSSNQRLCDNKSYESSKSFAENDPGFLFVEPGQQLKLPPLVKADVLEAHQVAAHSPSAEDQNLRQQQDKDVRKNSSSSAQQVSVEQKEEFVEKETNTRTFEISPVVKPRKLPFVPSVPVVLPAYVKEKKDPVSGNHMSSSLKDQNSEGSSSHNDSGQLSDASSGATPEHRSVKGRADMDSSIPSITISESDMIGQESEDDGNDSLFRGCQSLRSNQSTASSTWLSASMGSRDSLSSYYSNAGEKNFGKIPVTGEILFGLDYDYKTGMLEVRVKQCKDLAPAEPRKHRSDPYVKTYLLPDKTKTGKRKTRVKKHTLNPVFDEVLRYSITKSELENRTLWLTVWHSDRFGRNDFLGEVVISFDYYKFESAALHWYLLQPRHEQVLQSSLAYKGELLVSLKYVTAECTLSGSTTSLKKMKKVAKSESEGGGQLHVFVKQAKNLTAVRSGGYSDPFCKGYLLPEKQRSSKQKTPVIKKECNPVWNHMFVFEDVSVDELSDRCLELTLWDYDKLSSNDFLGGVRLNLGTGVSGRRYVDWMDAHGDEIALWQSMLNRPNTWVDGTLALRSNMGKRRL